MNKKIVISLISSLIIANSATAEFSNSEISDFTGDAFFMPPAMEINSFNRNNDKNASETHGSQHGTLPPLKKLRLRIKNHKLQNKINESQLAPTDPNASIYNVELQTSEFASKELKEDFDEMMPDGFEADEESVEDSKKAKLFRGRKNTAKIEPQNTEEIVLDCDNMDYDTEKYCLYAKGNVNVEFVKQGTVVKADLITYDRMNNTIKAEGNVKILKNNQTITGDYIFVDMNEENALIENPVANTATVEIRSKRGYVYGDKILQEEGSLVVDHSFPIKFSSDTTSAMASNMLIPPKQTLTEDMSKGIVKIEAKEIKIKQNGEHETLYVKKLRVKKGEKTVFKFPSVKLYTNKNHDYVESSIWEVGSIRGLGFYTGPGFVFELPKGSVLKAMPTLNYKSGIGIGAVGRFNSGTNRTQAGYGTAESKIVVHGVQKLDDNLYLQYGMNDYMDEWFLGRRRPKYGAGLVYNKTYTDNNFLIKGLTSQFSHRFDFGYYQDIDKDRHYENLNGTSIGTTRTRYMAEAFQTLYSYLNPDEQKSFAVSFGGELSAALYGTGDTQVIGRIGPRIHAQYKRWMQDVGYYQSVYEDNTPMPVYDAYRYGKSNLYVREYFRVCRFLTLCWFVSLNLSNDSPNDRAFQGNSFFISIGPDDIKFNIGYDLIRENMYATVDVMMDAKGTHVDYEKLEIKQDKKAKKEEQFTALEQENNFKQDQYKAPVLQKAVVEDIKTVEDVL